MNCYEFVDFATWCSGQTASKTEEIKAGEAEMEMQAASIQKAAARMRSQPVCMNWINLI